MLQKLEVETTSDLGIKKVKLTTYNKTTYLNGIKQPVKRSTTYKPFKGQTRYYLVGGYL